MHKRLLIFLAIGSGALPYMGGAVIVVLTRNTAPIAITGILICAICTATAYFVRTTAGPPERLPEARARLILDPMLYGAEFAASAVLVRYLFLH